MGRYLAEVTIGCVALLEATAILARADGQFFAISAALIAAAGGLVSRPVIEAAIKAYCSCSTAPPEQKIATGEGATGGEGQNATKA